MNNDQRQTYMYAVAAIAVGVVMFFVLQQPSEVGYTGLTRAEAKRAVPQSFTNCYANGLIRDEGDLYADGGRLLWTNKKLDRESIVFVVGGGDGEFIRTLYMKYQCQIFVFEGRKSDYDALTEMFKSFPHIRVYNYQLGKADGKVTLPVEGSDGAASPGTESSDLSEGSDSDILDSGVGEVVEVKNLGSVIQLLGIRQVKFVHADCGGCEYDLLEYIAENANRIEELQVAFTPYGDGVLARYCRIQELLANDFDLYYRYPWAMEDWKRKKTL